MLFSEMQKHSFQARKHKQKLLKIIMTIVFAALILAISLLISPSTFSMISQPSKMNTYPSSKGQNLQSKTITVNNEDSTIIQLQANQIGSDVPIKNLFEKSSISTSSNHTKIVYFHKNSQIAIVYDIPTKKIKFSAPADTGYKLLFPDELSNEILSALSSILLYLPEYLIEQFQKVTHNKIKFTTELSYDAVYNSTTKKYRIVSEEYLKFSDKVAHENQRDLADYVPVIDNRSSAQEIARELAKCYSRIAENFLNLVNTHQAQIEKIQRQNQESLSANFQKPFQISDKMLSCISLQPCLLRCEADVWRSSEMQTENIDKCRPLEIWSYVLYNQ